MADNILDQTYQLSAWRDASGFQVAATALLFYDYCLTFSAEVRCIWTRRFSAVTVLFLLNRYAYLLDGAVGLVQVVSWASYPEETANKICNIVVQIDSGAITSLYFVLAVFSSLRVFAVWSRSRTMAIITLCTGLVSPCLVAFDSSRLRISAASPPFTGCVWAQYSAGNFYVAEVCFTFTTELAVLVLTWMKTARALKTLSQIDVSTRLMILALRDGTVYFLAGAAAAIVPIGLGVSSSMTDPIISLCISRFLLGLRQAYLSDEDEAPDTLRTGTSIGFVSRLVGNLGAPVDWVSHEIPMEELWDEQHEDVMHISNDPLVTVLVLEAVAENTYRLQRDGRNT